jgi:ribosome-associated protein
LQPKRLARRIKEAAEDKKAEDILVLDIARLTTIANFFVIMHGNSDVHVRAIANHIYQDLKDEGMRALHAEGVEDGRWAVLDFGAVIVHVFYRDLREFYGLERLWGDARRVP